jgi:HSP20 family protein
MSMLPDYNLRENVDQLVRTVKEKQEELDKAITEYTGGSVKPAMDVMENEEQIVVKTDLPGVNREDIKIDLTEDTLQINAQFQVETEEEGVNYYKKERKYGEASRTMVLPAKVKINEVTANFENGVLTIIMPKLEKKEVFEVKVD